MRAGGRWSEPSMLWPVTGPCWADLVTRAASQPGRDVLVASPTGTGKTLTGFLVAIDAICRAEMTGTANSAAPHVLYVSPLRALAADVHQNLLVPLEGIRAEAVRLGMPVPEISVATRTGDTPPAQR